MSSVQCPKCGHEMNDYEISVLWCSNCNTKFESKEHLTNYSEEKQKPKYDSEEMSAIAQEHIEHRNEAYQYTSGLSTFFRVMGVLELIGGFILGYSIGSTKVNVGYYSSRYETVLNWNIILTFWTSSILVAMVLFAIASIHETTKKNLLLSHYIYCDLESVLIQNAKQNK